MNEVKRNRLIEFTAGTKYDRNYRLYVRDGRPIRIMCVTPSESTTIYPEDSRFNTEFQIIIGVLSYYENLKNLKKLYNALEDSHWKEEVNELINNRIDYFEKGLAILKS